MKKLMFVSAALMAVMLCAPLWSAVSAIVSWTNPIAYIDGRPLPVTDLKEITLKWGRSAAGPFDVGSIVVAAPATSVTVPNLICGDYYFVAYATVKTGEQSGQSANTALKATGVSCNSPNPPTGVTAS